MDNENLAYNEPPKYYDENGKEIKQNENKEDPNN